MQRRTILAVIVAIAGCVLAAQPPNTHAVLLAIDDLHMDFRSTPRVRKVLQDVLKGASEDQTWALVTTGTASIRLQPALGVGGLRAAVSRVTGNSLKTREMVDAVGDPAGAAEVRRRAEISDFAIADFVKWVARSNFATFDVVLLTDGYDSRLVPAMPGIVRAAAEARARFVAVSVRDLVPSVETPTDVRPEEWAAYLESTRASLRNLAGQTAGTVVFSREELDAAFARLSQP